MQGWLNWQHNFKRIMILLRVKNPLKTVHMIHTLRQVIHGISVSKGPVTSITDGDQDQDLAVTMHHLTEDQSPTALTILTPAIVM